MPSKTRKQHNAMCAAAHSKKRGKIPKRVAKKFCKADKKSGKFRKKG
jgi:hypothetical protein